MATAASVEHAANSDWAEWLGRIGLAARGVVYCVVALLAFRVGTGERGEQADSQGAIRTLGEQPLGKALLAALVVGFAGHAVWRAIRAVSGRGEGGGRMGTGSRLVQAAVAALYVGLLFSTLTLLDGGPPSDADRRQQGWTAELMSHAWGEWIVAAAGLVAAGIGVYLVAKGLREDFAEHLEPEGRRFAGFGKAGYTARGAVVVAVGWFLVKAALENDPNESVGVDGALHRLAEASYGPALLVVVSLGLLAFGLYSFVEARYRRVLES